MPFWSGCQPFTREEGSGTLCMDDLFCRIHKINPNKVDVSINTEVLIKQSRLDGGVKSEMAAITPL